MFRLISVLQEVQKNNLGHEFYAHQQVYHQETHYFKAASCLQENLTHTRLWHKACVDPEQHLGKSIWESERKLKMMPLLQGTISQSKRQLSDTVK